MSRYYLDHAATTPMRPGVWAAMEPYASATFGNPSSAHAYGRAARSALEGARERVAAVLRVQPREIVFTRGGTEANNLAVQGCVQAAASPGPVVISALEHPAVRDPAAQLQNSVATVPCTHQGFDWEQFDAALDASPALVSMMWVNNETGDVLPVKELATRCADRQIPFHSDAVQALGKLPVDLETTPVSMLTLTAHKFGGPKGTGALFVRTGAPLSALYFGGGQERNLRPGTSDVAGAVGLAEALEQATTDLTTHTEQLTQLRTRLEDRLEALIPEGRLHHAGGERAPHIVNYGVPGQDRSVLLAALDMAGVAASGGSACSSGASGPSPIIAALYGPDHDLTAVRLSLGWNTTAEDVDAAATALATVLEQTDD